jgi:hypothetical protein
VLEQKDVLRIIVSRSKSPGAKMNRNLRIELFTVVSAYFFAIIYYSVATTFTWIAAFLAVLLIFYLYYYTKKNQLLHQMTRFDDTLLGHLKSQINLLTIYMRWYGWIAAILTPIVFVIVLVAWKVENNLASWYWPGNQQFYLLFAAVGIAFSIISFLINKWYVYHLYGKHLEELKRMIDELNSVEGPQTMDH